MRITSRQHVCVTQKNASQVNIFKFKGVEYIGLESRKQDYDRDKAAGTNFVEDKIKRGDYDRGQRGKIQTCSAGAIDSTLHVVPAATAVTKAQTRSKAADSESIMDDFPRRVLCIRRGFGERESFRFKLIRRITEKVRARHHKIKTNTHSSSPC